MQRFNSLVIAAATTLAALIVPATAQAHYLWVTVDPSSRQHGTANIYFEGGPSPGDGQYLDPFVDRGTTWVQTLDSQQATPLKTSEVKQEGKRWLTATLPESPARSVDSYGKWGVYRYGDQDVLLHYYARHLDVRDHDDLHELARAKHLALDIVPHTEAGKVELKILWQGKPAADADVNIRGPGGFKAKLRTNASGVATFQAEAAGQYRFRTLVDEDKPGKEGDKSYELIRHQATLLLDLPVK